VVDDVQLDDPDTRSSDVLPEGLTHELPSADEFDKATLEAPVADNDDLEDLRRQLEAINSA
ncbi:unnamed protein product, partial [Sphenostylis stenocarpa]